LIQCWFCHEGIEFNGDYVGLSGKKIPLDILTGKPHDCKAKPRPGLPLPLAASTNSGSTKKKCHYCDQEIFFNPDITNPANGKLIPQDIWGNHKCKDKKEARFC
jgi:hypothetical protein